MDNRPNVSQLHRDVTCHCVTTWPRYATILAAGLLTSACANRVEFDQRFTNDVRTWNASEFDEVEIYYRGSAVKPLAVIIDEATDEAQFADDGWKRANKAQAPEVVASALDSGMDVAKLKDDEGESVGYLVSSQRQTHNRRKRYQLDLDYRPEGGQTYKLNEFEKPIYFRPR